MAGSAVAVAVATTALINSEAAKKTACEGLMPVFDAKTATIEQAQTYASCVQTLYPKTYKPEVIIYFKGIFVLFLVGMMVAWATQHRKSAQIDSLYFMEIFMGGVIASVAAIVVTLILYGVYWLFS